MDKEYSEMTYGELKASAKERGLSSVGTREVLLERLTGSEPVETPEERNEVLPKKGAPVSEREVEKAWKSDIQKMKDHLAKQRKVAVMIPLELGVSPEQAEKIPFVVNINGYRLSIKRGVFVDVPEQVAEIVKERLQSEGQIGRELRIDRDTVTAEALG